MNIKTAIITFSYAFYFTLGIANCSTETISNETCAVTVGTDSFQTSGKREIRFRLKKGKYFFCQPLECKDLRNALPRFFNQAPSIDLSTTTQARFLTVLSEMDAKHLLLQLVIQNLISWLKENDPKKTAYIGYSSTLPEKRNFFSRTLESMRFWEEKYLPATRETFNSDEIFNALIEKREGKYSSADIKVLRESFPVRLDKRYSESVELSKEDMSLLHQIQFMREALELEHAIANEGNVEEVLSYIYVHLNKRDHVRTQEWMMPWLKGLDLKSSLRNKLFDYINYAHPLNMVSRYLIYSIVTGVFICLPVFLIYMNYYYGKCSNPFYDPKLDPSSRRFVSPSLSPTAQVFELEKATYPVNRMAHALEADMDTVAQDTSETIKFIAGMILGNIPNFRTTLTGGLGQFAGVLNQENATLLEFEQTTDRCIPLGHVVDATSDITFLIPQFLLAHLQP